MRAQNCGNSSVGFIPLNDLGASYFRGFQGGLYGNGSNSLPQLHEKDGTDLAAKIVPLDLNGNYDPVNGRIVLLSVGMSNTSLEFNALMSIAQGHPGVNPKLKLVNGAQGGFHIDLLTDSNGVYWSNVMQILANAGVSKLQVQAVWYKNVDRANPDTTFPGNPLSLMPKHKTVLNILNNKFPNLKQCYFASRIYGGYATTPTSPEPNAYYSGWAAKWVIEDQISGDTVIAFKGQGKRSPWIGWGAYIWADGIMPRSDGLTWICPDDFNTDGTHPSAAGRVKVANLLFTFFMNSKTTMPWFRRNFTVHLKTAPEGFFNSGISMLRMGDTLLVRLRKTFPPYQTADSCVGIMDSSSLESTFNFYNNLNGQHYMQILYRNTIETWSRSGGENVTFGGILDYDMTSSALQAYGGNLALKSGMYFMYSGDVNLDGIIDGSDLSLADNDASVFATGYIATDITGDLTTDAEDLSIIDNNAFNSIQKVVP